MTRQTLKADILRLRNEGNSYNKIVEILGCSKGSVAYYCSADTKLAMEEKREQKEAVEQAKPRKICTKCNELKLHKHFYTKAASKDGLNSQCKRCVNEQSVHRTLAWREAKRKPCPGCAAEVAWDTQLCRTCTGKERTAKALSRTVAEVKKENKARWGLHVRSLSRKLYTFQKCFVCPYDKHVEIAHVIPVASFSDEATIADIHRESNILGLCPNHHWEFDHGMLSLEEILTHLDEDKRKIYTCQ